MTIYQLKPRFQQLLQPLATGLHRLGFTANMVTVIGFLVSVMIAVTAMKIPEQSFYALVWPIGLFLRMAFNALDGMIARQFGEESQTGAVLNEALDVISDILVCLPLLVVFPEQSVLIWIFILQSVLMEGAGMLGYLSKAGRSYKGPLGKSDRAFLLGVLGITLALGVDLSPFAFVALVALNLLIHIGFLNRLNHVW